MVDLVTIGLGVDSTQVNQGRDALGRFAKQGKKTQTATEKLSGALKTGLVVAMAAVGASVIASIKVWREFSKALSELSAITGATGQDLKFYKQQAMAMGAATTFAASEVVMAFKLIASAKPDLLASRDALAEVTREVLVLAEASGLTLPEAANALGGALNQFGKGAESASRFINVLAAGARHGSSEINATAEAMKNVGAIASSMGLSFEVTNAALQALAKNAIKGAEAGTGLRGVLLKLAKQTNSEFNPEIVGFVTAMQNLGDASLSTTEMMKLFEVENYKSAVALIQHRKLIDDLTKSMTATDTAYQQAITNTDNLDGDIKNMSSSWERTSIILGNVLDPALRATVKVLSWIGNAVSDMVVRFDDMGNALRSYSAVIESLLMFELDQAKAIIAARAETRAANGEKIKGIWAVQSAEELAAERKKKLIETARVVAAEAIELEKQRGVKRNAIADELAAVEDEEKRKLKEKLAEILELESIENEEKRRRELDELRRHEDSRFRIETTAARMRLEMRRKDNEDKKKAEQTFWNDSISIMNSGSKALFTIGKVAAIGKAIIDGYSAAIAAWKFGMTTGGPWVAAAYTAASLLKTGSMIASIGSTQISGGGSTTVSSGGGGGAVTVGTADINTLPAGSNEGTATKELRIVFEGDNPHSDAMRNFAKTLEETMRDMGSDTRMVLST